MKAPRVALLPNISTSARKSVSETSASSLA